MGPFPAEAQHFSPLQNIIPAGRSTGCPV